MIRPPKTLLRRSPKKKLVTLICGFRCKDGIVLCSDSQETVSYGGIEYRKSVQKISPHKIGNLNISIAGSGNAKLIESFIIRCVRKLKTAQPNSLNDLQILIEAELSDFHQTDVALCPDADDEKGVDLIIAASLTPHAYEVWVSENVRLRPMRAIEINGHEEPLYQANATRLYDANMTIAQGILAGIYVLTLAEETSNCVRGPMSVAIVRENGIWMKDTDYTRQMSERLSEYEREVHQLFLYCADTGVAVHELQDVITKFLGSALTLHRKQLDRLMQNLTIEKLESSNDPYPKYPLGSMILAGPNGFWMEHDPDKIRAHNEQTRAISEQLAKYVFFKEHLVERVTPDKYHVTATGSESGEETDLGDMTKDELGTYLMSRIIFLFDNRQDLMSLLDRDGHKVFFYEMKPKTSC